MISSENPTLQTEEAPKWPALASYVSALSRLAEVRLHYRRAGEAPENPDTATAWNLSLPEPGGGTWLVSVKRAEDQAAPRWREPVVLRMLEAMERNLSGSRPLREWPEAVQKAWSLVTGHPCRAMSLAEVANCVDLSAGYLGEQFERITGTSFKRILRDERVAYACGLLETTGRRVSEVASSIGGLSLSQFNRNFVSATGLSPTEWRTKFHHRRGSKSSSMAGSL